MGTDTETGAPEARGGRGEVRPSFRLGIGLSGFVDGIVLHQILQWHHMLTSTGEHPMTSLAGLEDNTLADGFFHAATWVVVAVGTTMMLSAWPEGRLAPPVGAHAGMLLAGWGAFNVVEGIVDHHLLGIHHVRDDLGGPVGWDIAFTIFGLLQVAVGLWLARRAREGAASRSAL